MARFQQSLMDHVATSQCINDLVSLMRFIPLNTIKQFLSQQIKLLNMHTSRNAYYHSLSIQQSLPCVIIQHCLSFTHNEQTKLVNKSFKNHYDQNQRILNRHIESIVNNNYIPHHIQFDETNNNVFVIDKNRSKLNETELGLGYKGPYQDFRILNKLVNDGDKILLHGMYKKTKNDLWVWQEPFKNIQIIGVGSNAILQDEYDYFGYFMEIQESNIYFENITFHCDDYDGCGFGHSFFRVTQNGTLSMKNCKMKFSDKGIFLTDKSQLFATQCMFDGGESGGIAIDVLHCRVKATVLGCTFSGCGHKSDGDCGFTQVRSPCIQVIPFENTSKQQLKCSVRCIGNIFKNNHGYPVGFHWVQHKYDDNSNMSNVFDLNSKVDCVLQSNYLQGKNGTHVKQEVNHANKLYFDNDRFDK